MRSVVIAATGIFLIVGVIVVFTREQFPRYREVEVPVGAIIDLEPEVDLSWLKKPLLTFMRQSLEIQQRAVAPGGGRDIVIEFCQPSFALDSLPRVDVNEPDRRALLYALRVDDPWNPWAKKNVDLFGVTNEGDRFHDSYRGGGKIEAAVSGDSTRVTGSRWWWVQPTVTHGAAGGVGFAAGYALGKSSCSDGRLGVGLSVTP